MDSDDAEIIDAGGDKVVSHRSARARGQTSGANVVFGYSVVSTFDTGKSSASSGLRTVPRPSKLPGCRSKAAPVTGGRRAQDATGPLPKAASVT